MDRGHCQLEIYDTANTGEIGVIEISDGRAQSGAHFLRIPLLTYQWSLSMALRPLFNSVSLLSSMP